MAEKKKAKSGKMSKAKGSFFERRVCNELSLWLTDGERKDLFWRSAMSGGRSTVGKKRGDILKSSAGDIAAVDPAGHVLTNSFYIECKFVKSLDLQALYTHKGSLIKYWGTTKDEAKEYKKVPMMIAKQNFVPTILCINKTGMELFGIKRNMINLHIPSLDLFMCDYQIFLDTIEPKKSYRHRVRI